MLFQSLDLKRPTTMSTVPKWDLDLVFRHIMGSPYEPLHLAMSKDPTHKSVFLLGLASAKRIGELHTLTNEISPTENWMISIRFDPTFLAKTQDPADPRTSMSVLTVPALAPTVSIELPERTLSCKSAEILLEVY